MDEYLTQASLFFMSQSISMINSIVSNILTPFVNQHFSSKLDFNKDLDKIQKEMLMKVSLMQIIERIDPNDPQPLNVLFRQYFDDIGITDDIGKDKTDELIEELIDLCKKWKSIIIGDSGDLSLLSDGIGLSIQNIIKSSGKNPLQVLEFMQKSLAELSNYALDMIAIKHSLPYGIPIRQVIQEPFTEPRFDLTHPVLLYGPPNVGKTCCAIRQAWQWILSQSDYSVAFLLNVSRGDTPSLIMELAERLPVEANILYVIDDIHFAKGCFNQWAHSLQDVSESVKARSMHILWVARDQSVADELVSNKIKKPKCYEYKIDRVVELYARRLQRYNLWQRIIAAFETGLDPRIALELEKWDPPTQENGQQKYNQFTEWLEKRIQILIRNEISDVNGFLQDDGFNAYLALLPFGSIGYPVEESFTQQVGISNTAAIESLVKNGLASIVYSKKQENRIALTEHPFKIRQKLNALAILNEHVRADDWIKKVYPDCKSNATIPEAALTIYLSKKRTKEEQETLISQLKEHAIWSGVRDSLSEGLRFLLNCVDWKVDDKIRNSATDLYRYLARYSCGEDEEQFVLFLKTERERWEQEMDFAEASAELNSGKHRLDHILYEIAYLDYLLGSYDKAEKVFSKSIDVSFELIYRGSINQNDEYKITNATQAFANIWTTAGLQLTTSAQRIIYKAFQSGQLTEKEYSELDNIANKAALIHNKFATANNSPQQESITLYIEALQSIYPELDISNLEQFIFNILQNDENSCLKNYLLQKELNVCCNAIEVSCWPLLYGLHNQRIMTEVSLQDIWHYFPLQSRFGIPGLLVECQQIELLYRWSKGEASMTLEDEVMSIAALMRADNSYQTLGDAVLLAWRCASSNEKAEALAWYLEHRVPSVGFNGLPKKALGYLDDIGCRILQ